MGVRRNPGEGRQVPTPDNDPAVGDHVILRGRIKAIDAASPWSRSTAAIRSAAPSQCSAERSNSTSQSTTAARQRPRKTRSGTP